MTQNEGEGEARRGNGKQKEVRVPRLQPGTTACVFKQHLHFDTTKVGVSCRRQLSPDLAAPPNEPEIR